jgi:predicted protein tyrosine phosphatase
MTGYDWYHWAGNHHSVDIAVTDWGVAETIFTECPLVRAVHLLSIWNHGTHAREKYPWVNTPGRSARVRMPLDPLQQRLILEFDDVGERMELGDHPPQEEDIRRIIDFAERLEPNARVLIHCAAGISRSTAAAWIVNYALLAPKMDRRVAAAKSLGALHQAIEKTTQRGWRPFFAHRPNKRMIDLADGILGTRGVLGSLWEEIYSESALGNQ